MTYRIYLSFYFVFTKSTQKSEKRQINLKNLLKKKKIVFLMNIDYLI